MDKTEEVISNQCKHFVLRKKRCCRMTVKLGRDFCGEHEPTVKNVNDEASAVPLRMKCPLDPTHSCYVSKLAKHLKICNANATDVPSFIKKGINLGGPDDIEANVPPFSAIPTDMVLGVVKKINKLYKNFVEGCVNTSNHKHNAMDAELLNESYGPNKIRHLIQTSALTGQIKNEGFLTKDTSFVEFGGGKGQMTYWLAIISNDLTNTNVVLVDKASHRHKMDNKLENMKHRVHRIRADISDLVLSKIDHISNSKKIVGVGKHLCGAATDLAFRCMVNDIEKVSGIVLAFCCHHRCTWSTYTGQKFLTENFITKEEFTIMCSLSSWATCGSGMSREVREHLCSKKIKIDPHLKNDAKDVSNSLINDSEILQKNRFQLTQKEREEIGRKTKHVIDYGRKIYLDEHGFSSKLVYYVTENLTPENLCIIAKHSINFNS